MDSIQLVQDGMQGGLCEHGGQLPGSIQGADIFFGALIGPGGETLR